MKIFIPFLLVFGEEKFKLQDVKEIISDDDPEAIRVKMGQFQFEIQKMINETFTVGFSWNQFEEFSVIQNIKLAQNPSVTINFLMNLEEVYWNTRVKVKNTFFRINIRLKEGFTEAGNTS